MCRRAATRRTSRVTAAPGWFLKSATIEGRDLQVAGGGRWPDVSGIVITFTDRPATVSGPSGRGAAGWGGWRAGVPLDYQSWLETDRPGGRPRVRPRNRRVHDDPPPGDLVAAVGLEMLDDWQPAMVKALADRPWRHPGERHSGPRGPAPPMRRVSWRPRSALRRWRAARGGARLDHGERSRSGQAAAATPIGSISGVVISDDPLTSHRARCGHCDRRASAAAQLVTDEAGRFRSRDCRRPATITGAKPSYLTLSAVRPHRRGSACDRARGRTAARDLCLVPRGAVIAGRSTIAADRWRTRLSGPAASDGERRTHTDERRRKPAQTDAHGGYRAYGLPPGDIVCAHPPIYSAGLHPQRGGEGAREVAAAEVQWARQQIQAAGRGGAFPPRPSACARTGPPFAIGPVFHPRNEASNATAITLGRGGTHCIDS